MFHDIASRLTPAEVVVSVIFYFIIHGIIWSIRKAEDETIKLVRKERKHIIRSHVKENHGGHPLNCDDCAILLGPGQIELVSP